ncbi:hypothetical protein [Paraclostridium sordellii]|uniref:hypothetical protein n=1 Tax=Paraclostridium sordellii TaxID=1505 RepID=UPI0022E2B42E|nr:hypothetical protein [Paeniclostridium sordellii]
MIYNGLGNGSIIERNKQRIEYVTKLSDNISKIEHLIDDIFISIEINDIYGIQENLSLLFYEKIPNDIIVQMCNVHNSLGSESRQSIKHQITNRYSNKATRGFIWNMFDIYIKLNESILV